MSGTWNSSREVSKHSAPRAPQRKSPLPPSILSLASRLSPLASRLSLSHFSDKRDPARKKVAARKAAEAKIMRRNNRAVKKAVRDVEREQTTLEREQKKEAGRQHKEACQAAGPERCRRDHGEGPGAEQALLHEDDQDSVADVGRAATDARTSAGLANHAHAAPAAAPAHRFRPGREWKPRRGA